MPKGPEGGPRKPPMGFDEDGNSVEPERKEGEEKGGEKMNEWGRKKKAEIDERRQEIDERRVESFDLAHEAARRINRLKDRYEELGKAAEGKKTEKEREKAEESAEIFLEEAELTMTREALEASVIDYYAERGADALEQKFLKNLVDSESRRNQELREEYEERTGSGSTNLAPVNPDTHPYLPGEAGDIRTDRRFFENDSGTFFEALGIEGRSKTSILSRVEKESIDKFVERVVGESLSRLRFDGQTIYDNWDDFEKEDARDEKQYNSMRDYPEYIKTEMEGVVLSLKTSTADKNGFVRLGEKSWKKWGQHLPTAGEFSEYAQDSREKGENSEEQEEGERKAA